MSPIDLKAVCSDKQRKAFREYLRGHIFCPSLTRGCLGSNNETIENHLDFDLTRANSRQDFFNKLFKYLKVDDKYLNEVPMLDSGENELTICLQSRKRL